MVRPSTVPALLYWREKREEDEEDGGREGETRGGSANRFRNDLGNPQAAEDERDETRKLVR